MNDDALALAFRAGLPYVGLRDHEHDPELDQVIPREAAAAAGVVALAASEDHVRLAVAHPAVNLTALAPYLGDRRVELAIASRAELEAIVGPPRPVPKPAAVEEPIAAEPLPVDEPPAVDELLTEEEPAAAAAESLADEEPPAEDEPLAEAEPLIEAEAAAAEPPADEALEPAPFEVAAIEAEPEPEPPPVERYKAQPGAAAPGEDPSWLQPAPRWRRVVRVLLVLLMLLVIAGGALLAYLLTR